MIQAAEKNVISFITYDARYYYEEEGYVFKKILTGEFDDAIKESAKKLRKYGEQYGGFFIRTMRKMNLTRRWPPWGGIPHKFKKTWKHIWHIFNEEGANEYATWVWDPFISVARGAQYANSYYPGDSFVDWIGFNGYNFGGQLYQTYQTFSQLFTFEYSTMRKKHPTKPIMIVETGTDEMGSKEKWVKNAFRDVKEKFQGIKAICWWDEKWSHNTIVDFDSRIDSSPEALQAFKESIADPYFLGKVPYRKV